LSIEDRDAK